MNHKEIIESLPFYISGNLPENKKVIIEEHLITCHGCRLELAMWKKVSTELQHDHSMVSAPRKILVKAKFDISMRSKKINIFSHFWQIIKSQVPLVHKEIWSASALVFILGVVITIIADRISLFLAIAPLVSAAGLAFIFGKGNDPAHEMVLAAPISQVQILLARSLLVFSYNFIFTLILSVGLSYLFVDHPISVLVNAWIAPMAFLSALGLFISLISRSENAIFISYAIWLSRYLVQTSEFKLLLGHFADLSAQFWQSPIYPYIISALLVAASILHVRKSEFTTMDHA